MTAKKIELSAREAQALKLIRSWFVRHGRGISVRELMKEMEFGSTRTAVILLNALIEKGVLGRRDSGELRILQNALVHEDLTHARTVEIPLVGTVPCGSPLFAEENIEAYFTVSTALAPIGARYFLLRADGDSMNKAGINDGDVMLIRQQSTAESGDRVVALIDDEATVKEIEFAKDVVVLKPRSTNAKHKPIVLARDFQIQGVVVAALSEEALKH